MNTGVDPKIVAFLADGTRFGPDGGRPSRFLADMARLVASGRRLTARQVEAVRRCMAEEATPAGADEVGPAAGAGPRPTEEQTAAIEAFLAGGRVVIEAGAGTGKTTTLRQLASAQPSRRGLYLAFNRAIAAEAKASFPGNVRCSTAHALAYAAIGHAYADRLKGPRVPGQAVAQVLGIRDPFTIIPGELLLQPKQVARIVMDTVSRFCYSADREITPAHVPPVNGIESGGSVRRDLTGLVVPLAQRAWSDLTAQEGRLKFGHDHYLKLWQLSDPTLSADFVLFDEAQDANPVIATVVQAQDHTQQILVGDANQAIYGWRGAVDAMNTFHADHRVCLTRSFRFGPAVAAEANKWLQVLDSPLRLRGTDTIASRVATTPEPDAVLCRSNAETVAQLLQFHERGLPAALVGGGREIKALAAAAITLKSGHGTDHSELCMFTSWSQVQDYVANDHGGGDLVAAVRLIDKHGADSVVAAVDAAVDESRAQVTISTAHKAKGREWPTVRIAEDFPAPKADGNEAAPPSRPEAMLAYVAVTRAQQVLDRSGLAWIDEHVAARAREAADQERIRCGVVAIKTGLRGDPS